MCSIHPLRRFSPPPHGIIPVALPFLLGCCTIAESSCNDVPAVRTREKARRRDSRHDRHRRSEDGEKRTRGSRMSASERKISRVRRARGQIEGDAHRTKDSISQTSSKPDASDAASRNPARGLYVRRKLIQLRRERDLPSLPFSLQLLTFLCLTVLFLSLHFIFLRVLLFTIHSLYFYNIHTAY